MSSSLSDYRKKLHALLHDNSGYNNDSDKSKPNQNQNQNQKLSMKIEDKYNINNEFDYNKENRKLNHYIELKDKKIKMLNKANSENLKLIKELNDKIENLENLNAEKDIRIQQLEGIVSDLEKNIKLNHLYSDNFNKPDNDCNDYLTSNKDDETDSNLSIDLNTKQLMNLNINNLSFNDDNKSGIYNSNKNNSKLVESDDDFEEYLYSV